MAKKPMRLPPLRVLRVRNPNKSEGNPCITAMSSVLGKSMALAVVSLPLLGSGSAPSFCTT